MPTGVAESDAEEAALGWLESLGYIVRHGPEVAYNADGGEHTDLGYAVKVLGEPTLKTIARELVASLRKNVTIDWTLRENVRAQMRVLVRRILRKYGYPPDKQEKATQTVLEQAALFWETWAVAA